MSSTRATLSRMGARRFQSRALLALIYAVLLVSIIYPMLMIVYESVFAASEGFFEHVLSVVTDGDVGLAIVNTLKKQNHAPWPRARLASAMPSSCC